MALHDQKCYIAYCFNYLDLINTMVLQSMPLTSHDADAIANSVKWLKRLCCVLDLWMILDGLCFEIPKHLSWNDSIQVFFYILKHRAIFSFGNLLLELQWKQVELNWLELYLSQACILAFIVYDKICIVTIIIFDVSGVTIDIDIDILIQQAFMICIQDYG